MLSCGSTLNIHQDGLKSGNLLHKQGFVDSQFGTTVRLGKMDNPLSPKFLGCSHLAAPQIGLKDI